LEDNLPLWRKLVCFWCPQSAIPHLPFSSPSWQALRLWFPWLQFPSIS
jgi:hypothetical protein